MTSELIKRLIPEDSYWERTELGFLCEHHYARPAYFYFVSDAELKEIDPKLPEAIDMLRWKTSRIRGSKIRRLLEYWQIGQFVTNNKGENYVVGEVSSIKLKKYQVVLICKASTYKELYSEASSCNYLMYTSIASELTLLRSWLNKHSPGWEGRYMLSREFELNITESFKFLLGGVQPQKSQDLPQDFQVF